MTVAFAEQQEATRDLVNDLERAIGAEQVRFDHMSRLLYSTDASNYQIMPVGVTVPRDADDVVAIHELARRYNTPLLPRGGGSSLAGQTVGRAIVMDFSKWMRRVRAINAEESSVVAEPGLVLGQLNQQLAGPGLMFGPDPASAERATIGGCIGNNATGAHSILYGMTADHVKRLEVVLANGERTWLDADSATLRAIRARVAELAREQAAEMGLRWPKTFRSVAGYALNRIDPAAVDLRWLFAGSEGTLGTIVAAQLNLVPTPTMRRLALVHFDELRAALEAVPALLELKPSAIEMMDRMLMERTRASAEFAPKLAEFIKGDPAAVQVVEFYGESESELDRPHRAAAGDAASQRAPWRVDPGTHAGAAAAGVVGAQGQSRTADERTASRKSHPFRRRCGSAGRAPAGLHQRRRGHHARSGHNLCHLRARQRGLPACASAGQPEVCRGAQTVSLHCRGIYGRGGEVCRHNQRRTRHRPGARRIQPQTLRRFIDGGLPRSQASLRPGEPDESGQNRRLQCNG